MKKGFSESFFIDNRKVGQDQPVFIVAEAGVAHLGSIDKARQLVDLAVSAGVDAIKFQAFKTEALISRVSEEWVKRLRPKELPFEAFDEIATYCKKRDIIFFATAHDEPSLAYLAHLDVPAYKIGSGEVSNWPFLGLVASKKRPVILSTGMYTMAQIHDALGIFAAARNPDVAVLHCITQYPTQPLAVNLRAITTIRDQFSVITGYSDHTQGIHFPIAAVALGAKVIEKHITLDFDIPNAQDWKVSCGPDDLSMMVNQIREIEEGIGSGKKSPGPDELLSIHWARKSLVASMDIALGEVITANMLKAKRPGTGISPDRAHEIIGKKTRKKIRKDALIQREHLI